MYLMLKNTPLLRFDFEENIYEVLNNDLLPISLRDSIVNMPNGPEDVSDLKVVSKNEKYILDFFGRRIMDNSRRHAKKLLNAFDFPQDTSEYTKMEIACECKAVSASDDYWINDDDMSYKWEDINPRTNNLDETVSCIALAGTTRSVQDKNVLTPELTNQGTYAKAWIKENDDLYLYKAGTDEEAKECKIEVMVSNILDCTNVPHVSYSMDKFLHDGEELKVCKCKNLCTDELSIVSARELKTWCARRDKDFTETTLDIDKEMFYKTCIVDYLISNPDRHSQNWGFYMENNTGRLIGCHPLFDHNNAFNEDLMKSDSATSKMMDCSMKEAAIYALKNCDFQITRKIPRKAFINRKHRKSFYSKAKALGVLT